MESSVAEESSQYVSVLRKQRMLSEEEFQIAIELWNFDVSQRFRR